MSFTKKKSIYIFVISRLSEQTVIQSQIDLEIHWIYMGITWKIHGILCNQRSGNPELWFTVLMHQGLSSTITLVEYTFLLGINTKGGGIVLGK